MALNKIFMKRGFLNYLIFSGILFTNIINPNKSIALKIAPIAEVYQKKNLCIRYLKNQIDRDKLIKRLKIVKQANPSSICDSILKS